MATFGELWWVEYDADDAEHARTVRDEILVQTRDVGASGWPASRPQQVDATPVGFPKAFTVDEFDVACRSVTETVDTWSTGRTAVASALELLRDKLLSDERS
jgi:hypothetical protein